ncbi:MAG: PTS sugar transporter subunit IIB [Actinomycetales bacterium]|nr:PTS sugar transporter subunit IIB [Actinomycetales bacterium]
MKLLAVCGMGIGTSVLLKMNAEKVLRLLEIEATVDATDLASAQTRRDAQVILTTPDLVDQLQGLPAEVIAIEHFFDLEEITEKLSHSLG